MRREHTILTPESVEFVLELAGPVSRFMAVLLDHLIMVACYAAIFGLMIFTPLLPGGILFAGIMQALAVIAMFVVSLGYFVFFEWRWNGQTPGKRLLGLRVVDDRGLPVDFYQAAVRNLFRIVDAVPILYATGGATMWFNPRHKRLGDFAARTLVVRIRKRVAPTSIMAPGEKYNTLQEDGALRRRIRARLTPEEKEVLLQLCLRRDELEIDARQSLFMTTAAYLEERLDLAREPFLSEEKFVQNIAAIALAEGRGRRTTLAEAPVTAAPVSVR